MKIHIFYLLLIALPHYSCTQPNTDDQEETFEAKDSAVKKIEPIVITEPAKHDTDDPAIWIHPNDPSKSLIIGTDKDQEGALYVYDLKGKVIEDKVVRGLKRPNNVDIAYGFELDGRSIDIAVVTERLTNRIRIFSLPDMQAIDNGGIEVFVG
ncbi:MAG TPA: phytase, partial [Cyclobacteriaceae bacterium]|nr:phytase [Cyclobacteriaceae bacterium]